MVDIISRDELQAKIDGGAAFTLVETLAEVAYQHAHLPGAINLPPDRGAGTRAPPLAGQGGRDRRLLCQPHVTRFGQGRPGIGGHGLHERQGLRRGQVGLGRGGATDRERT